MSRARHDPAGSPRAYAWPGSDGALEPIDASSATMLAHSLHVLADPTRIRVLSLIASHGGRPATVTEIVDAVGLSQSTVSHHLRVLVDAGFVTLERSGTWSLYRARPEALDEVAARIASAS